MHTHVFLIRAGLRSGSLNLLGAAASPLLSLMSAELFSDLNHDTSDSLWLCVCVCDHFPGPYRCLPISQTAERSKPSEVKSAIFSGSGLICPLSSSARDHCQYLSLIDDKVYIINLIAFTAIFFSNVTIKNNIFRMWIIAENSPQSSAAATIPTC